LVALLLVAPAPAQAALLQSPSKAVAAADEVSDVLEVYIAQLLF
jgi:hypothetical protein